jgi:hypothetical protein
MTPVQLLSAILIAGLLGMLGQGIRAVAGLKKMNDDATANGASSADLFNAARLLVTLMVGFLAGVAGALAIGIGKLTDGSLTAANATEILLSIAAAGYAGTDFLEAFAPLVTSKSPPSIAQQQSSTSTAGASAGSGPVQSQTASPQPPSSPAPAAPQPATPALAAGGTVNPKYGVTFASLVPGGFYSADPDDLNVRRSIRTNNPGALNFSGWQKTRPGYVGITQPDSSSGHNVTTIYRTPEHGIAAWYHLIARLYNFPGGSFSLNDLAGRYSGGSNSAAISAYVNGWNRWLNPPMAPATRILVTDSKAMLTLATAMFSHEAGVPTPIRPEQISFAVDREAAGTLPA